MKNFTIILILALLISCGLSTTSNKKIEFSVDKTLLSEELKKMGDFEDISYAAKTVKQDKISNSLLSVRVINGKRLPGDDSTRRLLGIEIAHKIRSSIKNPDEFNTYEILYTIRKEAGGLTSDTYRGFVYASQEIEQAH